MTRADHGVAVAAFDAAPWTVPLAVIEQSAEHYGGIAVDRGIGDRHPNSTVRTMASATTAAVKEGGSDTGLPVGRYVA